MVAVPVEWLSRYADWWLAWFWLLLICVGTALWKSFRWFWKIWYWPVVSWRSGGEIGFLRNIMIWAVLYMLGKHPSSKDKVGSKHYRETWWKIGWVFGWSFELILTWSKPCRHNQSSCLQLTLIIGNLVVRWQIFRLPFYFPPETSIFQFFMWELAL